MKKVMLLAWVFLWFGGLSAQAGGLDFGDFLQRLNVSAQADFGAFKAQLSADFGTPSPRIETLLASVPTPADAYMCLKVSEVAKQPLDTVVREFSTHRDKGWGVIAGNLGIKPGSAQFHALKEGRYSDSPAEKSGGPKAKGHRK